MFGGLTVALVTGVPFSTFIGQHFGWRETFLAVSILGVIALISSLILVPNNIPGRASAQPARSAESINPSAPADDLRHYRAGLWRRVYRFYFPGADDAGAGRLQPVSGELDPAGLWCLGGYRGSVWGGKLADKHGAVSALKFIFAALVVLLLVFQLTASVHYAPRWQRYW